MTQLIASYELAIGCESPSSLDVIAPLVGASFCLEITNGFSKATDRATGGGTPDGLSQNHIPAYRFWRVGGKEGGQQISDYRCSLYCVFK